MEYEVICVVCPEGCHMTVERDFSDWKVEGNKCPRGRLYGIEEIESPKRTVTYVVKTDSEALPFIPVKTDKPVGKEKINDILHELAAMKLKAPIKRGESIRDDIDGAGANIVLTRTLATH